jgi:NAD/NADP transhydrogenase beta subunit
MSEFRERLLGLEPMSEERNQQLRQEIKIMFEPKLTRFEMVYWGLSVAGSTLFALSALVIALFAPVEMSVRALWGSLGAFNALVAVFIVLALRKRSLNLRHQFALGKALVGVTLLVTMLILVNAIAWPSLVNLAWGLVGLTSLVLIAMIALHNQILSSELNTRERSLQLEYRLAELAEKLGEPR